MYFKMTITQFSAIFQIRYLFILLSLLFLFIITHLFFGKPVYNFFLDLLVSKGHRLSGNRFIYSPYSSRFAFNFLSGG